LSATSFGPGICFDRGTSFKRTAELERVLAIVASSMAAARAVKGTASKTGHAEMPQTPG
jgi:hypothetical protein